MSGGCHPRSKFNAHRWSNLNARRHYADHPITTARLEAGNVAIGLLRRRARGFRDTAYLKLKIYQLNTPDQPSFLYANVPTPALPTPMPTA